LAGVPDLVAVELDDPLLDEPLELLEPEVPDDGLPALLEPEPGEPPDEEEPESDFVDGELGSLAAALPESAEEGESGLSLLFTALTAPARESVR
jgi:hypothetical protein